VALRGRSRRPTPGPRRGRLFRRYALVFGALVCASLLISGGVQLYFSYQGNRQALLDVQSEKAALAALSIQHTITTITHQVAAEVQADSFTFPRTDALRESTLLTLMRTVPDLTDLAYLDSTGIQRSHVSRQIDGLLDTGPTASHLDRSTDPIFLKVTSDGPLYGPVLLSGGRAYLTFAVVDEPASVLRVLSVDAHYDGATIAIVDLSFIHDALVAALERKRTGPTASSGAQVVDAHGQPVTEITPLKNAGGPTLASSARIDPPGWLVTIEQPDAFVFAPLNDLVLGVLLILAIALLLGVLGSLYLARRLVKPIELLQAGSTRLAEGDLSGRITVRTRDDLQTLAEEFNRMTERLNASKAELDEKVRRRSSELAGAAAEIEDKSRQLEAASQRKSAFLSDMSHELRTPLNAVIGFSGVLGERMYGDLNPRQAEYVEDIHASGLHLLSLVDDVLDLTKVEAGQMELRVTTFSIGEVLSRGLTMVRERATRQGVALESDFDPQLGTMEADERKLKQIIFNLLANGVKFTPAGGVVRLSAVLTGDQVVVKVIDTGIGIAPGEQGRIFDEFQQGGTDRTGEGTGLGLTLVKKFVELHGGRIQVESEPGKGSTFTIELPLRQPSGAGIA
jgi:signal transduction histidine kinase